MLHRAHLHLLAVAVAALAVGFSTPFASDAFGAGEIQLAAVRPDGASLIGDVRNGVGRLVLRDEQGRETNPLEVRELKVRAHVVGPVALTEIEQTFFNHTDTRAEGTFYFRVPAGASLSRLAMYGDGVLLEG